jgi:hypothetical protein
MASASRHQDGRRPARQVMPQPLRSCSSGGSSARIHDDPSAEAAVEPACLKGGAGPGRWRLLLGRGRRPVDLPSRVGADEQEDPVGPGVGEVGQVVLAHAAGKAQQQLHVGRRPCPLVVPARRGRQPVDDGWQARSARSGGCGVPSGKWGRPSLSICGSGRFCAPLARTHRTHSRAMAATSCGPAVPVAAGEPPRAEQPASPASRSGPTINRSMTPPWPDTSADREALKPAPWAHHRRREIAIPFRGRAATPPGSTPRRSWRWRGR